MDNKCLVVPQYGCSVADLYHGERNHQGKGNKLLFPEAGDETQTTRPHPLRVATGSEVYSSTMAASHDFFDLRDKVWRCLLRRAARTLEAYQAQLLLAADTIRFIPYLGMGRAWCGNGFARSSPPESRSMVGKKR
jgi:hypothetical protein